MIARFLTFSVLVVGILPNPPAQQAPAHPIQTLLALTPLSDEIAALTVSEYVGLGGPPRILVEFHGPPVHEGARTPKRLSAATTQVWLLRKDGTTAGSLWQPMETLNKDSLADFGVITDGMAFSFAPIPTKELVGVVVSVNGELYVHEIHATFAH